MLRDKIFPVVIGFVTYFSKSNTYQNRNSFDMLLYSHGNGQLQQKIVHVFIHVVNPLLNKSWCLIWHIFPNIYFKLVILIFHAEICQRNWPHRQTIMKRSKTNFISGGSLSRLYNAISRCYIQDNDELPYMEQYMKLSVLHILTYIYIYIYITGVAITAYIRNYIIIKECHVVTYPCQIRKSEGWRAIACGFHGRN